MYVESFGNPRRFGRLARRVARTKPILALKSGTTATGQQAASSHTAALAGSEAAVDALFHQAGVIRASSLEELVDVAALLSQPARAERSPRRGPDERRRARHPLRRRLRGGGSHPARPRRRDACRARRAAVAGGERRESGRHARRRHRGHLCRRRCRSCSKTPQVDAAIVLFVPTVTATADEVANAVDEAAARSTSEKPVLAVVLSAEGIPPSLRRDGATRRRLPLPGVGGAGARAPGSASRVAPPAARHRSRPRGHRSRRGGAGRRAGAHRRRRRLAQPG